MNSMRSRKTAYRWTISAAMPLIAYALTIGYFYFMQTPMIIHPTDQPDVSGQLDNGGESVGIELGGEGKSSDATLFADWIPADEEDAPVLLYLHGQNATRRKHRDHHERFHRMGLSVLVLDYRGFAETYGEVGPSESTMYEDAVAALKYLQDVKHVPSNRILIYGHSLGGAVAIELATRKEAQGTAGIIVESTFTSVLDMSAIKYGGWLKYLPVDLLLTVRFDSLSKIHSVTRPLLIIHGLEDDSVPFTMSERLYAKAGGTPEKCWIDGAGHADCGAVGTEKYCRAVESFVAESLHKATRGNAIDGVGAASKSGNLRPESK